MADNIVRECWTLAQKQNKTSNNSIKKMIYGDLWKRLKYEYARKGYMDKRESIWDNETQKIPWDFEIQTDPLIPARRSDLMLINENKNDLSSNGFYWPQNVRKETELILFTNPSTRAGYDTRSIFKRSLTGWNSEFSFS